MTSASAEDAGAVRCLALADAMTSRQARVDAATMCLSPAMAG